MSGPASTSVAVGMGVGGGVEMGYLGYRAPFTAVQWQELEHQAMIYKYLVAGVPVPPDLVLPIRRSFDAFSTRFFHHPSLGYCSYYGKKFDPEPGRCRRTDGKKWRCSKDAHPDSKYCERHMHRGPNRSRKPVESQSTSQSLLTTMSHISSGGGSNVGSFHGSGSGSYQNMPLYSGVGSEGSSFGSNATKLQMEPISYGVNNKEFRYIDGLTLDSDDHGFSLEGNLGLGSSTGSSGTWRFMPQVSRSSMLKSKADSLLLGPSSAQHGFGSINAAMSKEQQPHCFLACESGSPDPIKKDQHLVHPFFNEWPKTKDMWSTVDDSGSNKNIFSSTQLSMSIPRASSDFSSRSAYSTDDT